MDREIGIGIVGCGSIARWKYAENLAVLPGASLRAFFGGRAYNGCCAAAPVRRGGSAKRRAVCPAGPGDRWAAAAQALRGL